MKILDVGCGNNKTKGAIGIDGSLSTQADVICEFKHRMFPFKDNIFDLVVCKQIIEHLSDTESFLKELHRLGKNGARIIIQTPHFSSYMAYGDYTHCHVFSFFFLDNLAQKASFKIIKKEITFHRAFRRYGINWIANKFPLTYERFWAYIFPAEHIYFELEIIKS
jgi:2-polyprenyl-3-methyl-5-hydroxy-6-metoxy-1,4-benzoquinol methylase